MARRPSRYLAWLTTRSQAERLPQRVVRAIRLQQESGEILIGWFQLGVVVIFGTLYTVAPKTFTDEAAFAPVPWVLGAYFVFSVVRLVLAHRRRLPDWLLYVSVVADMALLMGLIWSFHLQYVQPPSFYLKAPTLLYVFIFIALRALHFDARFVLLSGVVAAVGWLVLVLYVAAGDGGTTVITRDYVQYMTSNSLLVGAEFDKIISILVVTVILSVAIARARELLVQSVVVSSTADDLSRFVPAEVVRRVRTAEEGVAPGQGEVRMATILFTDLEQFTSIGESLSPEQLITTLNDYFTAVAAPIERHGGVINQFQGDAILASFNLPESHPEHAANAVRAAVEIRRVLEERRFGDGLRLRSRVGINSGVVVGGLVGTGSRLGYTVHGDDVNLAARLEQLNKQHGTRLLVSESTVNLIQPGAFQFRRIGEVAVRGRQRHAVVYTVDEDTAKQARA